jgi:hypothetical protein
MVEKNVGKKVKITIFPKMWVILGAMHPIDDGAFDR